MTDTQSWGESWLQSQQQAFEMWNQWLQQAGDAAESASGNGIPDISDSMEDWWKAVSGGLNLDAQAVFPKVMDAAQNYLGMSDTLWETLQTLGKSQEDWAQAVKSAMEQFSNNVTSFDLGQGDAWKGFADSWGLDADVWNKFVSNNSLGGFNPSMNPVAMMMGPGAEAYQRMFHTPVPALGAQREWQEKIQLWMDLAKQYANAAHDYSALLQEANTEAVSILGDALVNIGSDNAPDNLRAMYDLWVDSGEAAYAKLATEDRFIEAQAEQMNALLRLKNHEQCMANDYLQMLNIPTRRELDSAHKRLQDARRELRHVKQSLSDAKTESANLRKTLKAEMTRNRKAAEQETVKIQEQIQAELTRVRESGEAAMIELRAETGVQLEKAADVNTAEINHLKNQLNSMATELVTLREAQAEAQAQAEAATKAATEAAKAAESVEPVKAEQAPAAKKVAPKKAAPKKAAPKKAAPKKATTKKAAPKKAAPKKAAPKKTATKKAAPKPAGQSNKGE